MKNKLILLGFLTLTINSAWAAKAGYDTETKWNPTFKCNSNSGAPSEKTVDSFVDMMKGYFSQSFQESPSLEAKLKSELLVAKSEQDFFTRAFSLLKSYRADISYCKNNIKKGKKGNSLTDYQQAICEIEKKYRLADLSVAATSDQSSFKAQGFGAYTGAGTVAINNDKRNTHNAEAIYSLALGQQYDIIIDQVIQGTGCEKGSNYISRPVVLLNPQDPLYPKNVPTPTKPVEQIPVECFKEIEEIIPANFAEGSAQMNKNAVESLRLKLESLKDDQSILSFMVEASASRTPYKKSGMTSDEANIWLAQERLGFAQRELDKTLSAEVKKIIHYGEGYISGPAYSEEDQKLKNVKAESAEFSNAYEAKFKPYQAFIIKAKKKVSCDSGDEALPSAKPADKKAPSSTTPASSSVGTQN